MLLLSKRANTTDDGLDKAALVAGAYDTRMFKLTAKVKAIMAGGKMMHVRQDTETMIVLPNGQKVRLSRDASGCATQIEENDRLHGVARPNTYRMRLRSVDEDQRMETQRFIEECARRGVRVPRKVRQHG